MSYTPYEDGEYPQMDYMYTEDGDRILIDHDLASLHEDDRPVWTDEDDPAYSEWEDYTEYTYADEVEDAYDGY